MPQLYFVQAVKFVCVCVFTNLNHGKLHMHVFDKHNSIIKANMTIYHLKEFISLKSDNISWTVEACEIYFYHSGQ